MKNDNNVNANSPTIGGLEYHIRLKEGDVPGYMLLPGAPERTEIIANNWENTEELARYREFRTLRGKYAGIEMACTSTGIGTTSAEICIHELNNIGVHTGIRVGTTGSISPRFHIGDLIIPVACIRADGTSNNYIRPDFPAIADLDVINALGEACERLGYRYGYGIMHSPSSLYIGQGRPIKDNGYWPSFAQNVVEDLKQAGVTNMDTDSAGQFIVGYLHGMRMGTILAVIADRERNVWDTKVSGEDKACRAACEAIKILMEKDKKRSELRL